MLLLGTASLAQAQVASPPPTNPAGVTPAEYGPPRWPQPPVAPRGAPNVLVIMTDDVGFGSSSAFGGPVPTPTFDALAAEGLRYNRFNTTALCSPTRAALLTGRDAHRVGMGRTTNAPAAGFPGYDFTIPKSAGTIAAALKANGYNTAAFGKWHIAPDWELSSAGPFDRWPTGLGFEYYYGFLGGDSSQWDPALVENTRPIEHPKDPNYILDRDLADQAVHWLRDHQAVAPAKPFFIYYATGTAHAPHHAPSEWLARFRGRFDQGWDRMRELTFARQKKLGIVPADAVLTPRPDVLPAWNSLSPARKRIASRLMEAYAAALSYADHEIGRVVDELRRSGQLDNTLVIYVQGDNGSSAEGGLTGLIDEGSMFEGEPESEAFQLAHLDAIGSRAAYNIYPAGWAWAMDTPFPFYKQAASHLGGVRNGLVIAWPRGIKARGEIRSQFHYVTDLAPTILDAAGLRAPETIEGVAQEPLDGISMRYSFDQPAASSPRHTQVFETVQNMAIYHDGWWANTVQARTPWNLLSAAMPDPRSRGWELYDLSKDFSQAHDLARKNPAKLAEMKALFWSEAERNKLLPLNDGGDPGTAEGRPSLTSGRTEFDYPSGLTRIPEDGAPRTLGKSFEITADVDLASDRQTGVMVTHGGRYAGYAFYLVDGRPAFHYNAVAEHQYRIVAPERVAAGRHRLEARFHIDEPTRGSGGTMTLLVDGREVASGRIDRTIRAWISMSEGFDVGEDTITPINGDYDIEHSRLGAALLNLHFKVM